MNPQEYYIDVSSGRFLDNSSAIPVENPKFFSDETKTIKLNVRKVKNNIVSDFPPSSKSKYKIRLGTPEYKLADGVDVSTAPPELLTATGIVVTMPSKQVKMLGVVSTYSAVTAQIEAIITPTSGVTALLSAKLYEPTLVTAAVTLTYVNATVSTSSTKIQATNLLEYNKIGAWDRNQVPPMNPFPGSMAKNWVDGRFVLDLTATLNTGTPAVASGFYGNGILSSVDLISRGAGYKGTSTNVVVSGGRNPTVASFNLVVSGGSVVSISIASAGSGFPSGQYEVSFNPAQYTNQPVAIATANNGVIESVLIVEDGGGNYNHPGATATIKPTSVTATISATVSNGFVTGITITNAGSGYTSNPTIIFQNPRGGISDIIPSNAIGAKVDGKQRFMWVYGLDRGTPTPTTSYPRVPLNFTPPPQSVTEDAIPSTPEAYINFVESDARGNIWEIDIVNYGYGYVTAPVVTHDPALCSTSRLYVAPFHRGIGKQAINAPLEIEYRTGTAIPQSTTAPNETRSFGYFLDRTKPATIRNGGCFIDYTTWLPDAYGYFTGTYDPTKRSALRGIFGNPNLFFGDIIGFPYGYVRLADATAKTLVNTYNLTVTRPSETPLKYMGGKTIFDTAPVEYTRDDVFLVSAQNAYGFYTKDTVAFTLQADGNDFTNQFFPRHFDLPNRTGSPYCAKYAYDKRSTFTTNDIKVSGSPIPGELDFTKIISGLAGKSDFVSFGVLKKNVPEARYGKLRMVIPEVNYGYRVHFIPPYTDLSRRQTSLGISLIKDNRIVSTSVYGGGAFETYWEVEDYGNDCVQNIGGDIKSNGVYPSYKDGAGYLGYKINTPFFVSKSANIQITVPTLGKVYGAYNPTVASRVTPAGIEWYFSDGGLGFGDRFDPRHGGYANTNKTPETTVITVSVVSQTNGYIGTAKLTNTPKGYLDGEYDCNVGSPASGTAAAVKLIVSNKTVFVNLESRGDGYTSAPIVTAPAPNEQGGYLSVVTITNTPVGYGQFSLYECEVEDSPTVGGTARVQLELDFSNRLIAKIINPGYGYTSIPVITAPGFETAELGRVIGYTLKNNPSGYVPDRPYLLTIGESPIGDSANATMILSNSGLFGFDIQNLGSGYTSKPIVIAPPPDAPQGTLAGGSVICAGLGYKEGEYIAEVSEPPAGGEMAAASILIQNGEPPAVLVKNPGAGYVTRPIISVPTPAGSVVSGITITCRGNYYINETAQFKIIDPTGVEASIGPATVKGGEIIDVPVSFGGNGYTDPQIQFSPPTAPAPEVVPDNQIRQIVNITTPSASAILGAQNEKQILFEVYEVEGSTEQVVVQANATLKKRVLE